MQNVPKIVRERLNAVMPIGDHPDADVLSAFAERSLPEAERTVVLEHLGRCGDCRDVLALALPEPEAAQTVIAPARGGWLKSPVLRWGFVAAGAVAIVSIGVLQYQRHLQPATMVARQRTNAPATASNVEAQPASPASAALSEKQAKSAAEAPSSLDALSAGRAGSESNQLKLIAPAGTPQVSDQRRLSSGGIGGTTARGQFLHGPAMPTQWQQQTARVQAAPAVPSAGAMQQSTDLTASKKIPPTSQMVQVEAPSQATVNAEAHNRPLTQDQDSQIQAQSSQPQQESDYLAGAIGKAKPAAGAQAGNAAPGQPIGGPALQLSSNGSALTQLSQVGSALPIWSISPAGGLQRSFDQGQTWQDVDVNASFAPGGAMSLAVVAKTATAKDAVANRKVLKDQAGGLVFRAVTTIGPEVWAGGSNGALYHSLDAGNHWTQVVPSAEGTSLTGDIVGLEFPDAQHGKLTTSTAEIWTTGDGGQTWQKQ